VENITKDFFMSIKNLVALSFLPSLLMAASDASDLSNASQSHRKGSFISYIEFLYWQPNENTLEFADVVTEENVIGVATSSSGQPEIKKVFEKGDWGPGFRLGFGWNQDEWDVKADWVWFNNHSKKTIKSDTNSALNNNTGLAGTENGLGIYGTWLGEWIPADLSTYINEVPSQLVYPGPFEKAKATSHLFYNTIDLETGYSIKGKVNTLRFLFGVRGAIIKRHSHATYSDYTNLGSLLPFVPVINGFSSGSYNGRLNFWGVGPRLGIGDQLTWRCGMRLFGQLSGSLLYGPMFGKEVSSLYSLPFSVPSLFGGSNTRSQRTWITAGNIQAVFGLGWKRQFSVCDFGVYAAWESNLWILPSLSSSIYPSNGNVSLNGIDVGVEFSY
jgi:hypothetical protein